MRLLKITLSACMRGCCMVLSAVRVMCIAPSVYEIAFGVCDCVPVSLFVCVAVSLPRFAYVLQHASCGVFIGHP